MRPEIDEEIAVAVEKTVGEAVEQAVEQAKNDAAQSFLAKATKNLISNGMSEQEAAVMAKNLLEIA